MFANIGPAEAIIILIALISAIFGRKKTTEIARDVGQASLEFKKAQKEYKDAEEPPPVDAAKAEVEQLAQLAQQAKDKSKSKGGEI